MFFCESMFSADDTDYPQEAANLCKVQAAEGGISPEIKGFAIACGMG
jgi:hypothetical protein